MIVKDDKNDQVELEYVSKEDVPKILLGVFVGQKDCKRIDPADLVLKYQDQSDKKHIVEHILDQVWNQYDADKEKGLDEY